jgi:hypothetical protein
MKPFTVVGLALAAALLVLAVMNARSKPPQTAARPPVASQEGQRARSFYPPPRSGEAGADGAPTTRRAFAARRTRRVVGGTVGATQPTGQLPTGEPQPDPNAEDDEMEPVVPLEVARVALTFVGQDPDAEDAWVEAINDPALSPKDRQDLIEDLNEEGFPDPKNITVDDLPLILGRLELIEELGPDAMDEVNADAFAEAYKDLTNMLEKIDAQLRAEEEEQAAAAAEAEVNPSADTWAVHQRYARRVSARR